MSVVTEVECLPIAEFPAYIASTDGQVWRAVGGPGARVHKMKPIVDKDGYHVVDLSNNGISKRKKVSRLVATTFIPNPENKPLVDHINRIKSDNRVENLRWATHKENQHNIGLRRTNTSGYRGVSYKKRKGKYEAAIVVDGKYRFLGLFQTAYEAHLVASAERRKLYGEFCNDN